MRSWRGYVCTVDEKHTICQSHTLLSTHCALATHSQCSLYFSSHTWWVYSGISQSCSSSIVRFLVLFSMMDAAKPLYACFFFFFPCKEESLGQGSFTRIFKGYKLDVRDGEKQETKVFLKELDSIHRNRWEVKLIVLLTKWSTAQCKINEASLSFPFSFSSSSSRSLRLPAWWVKYHTNTSCWFTAWVSMEQEVSLCQTARILSYTVLHIVPYVHQSSPWIANSVAWMTCRHHGSGVRWAWGPWPLPEERKVGVSELETGRRQAARIRAELSGTTRM